MEKLRKSCGKAVEKLWKSCGGKAVGKLRKSCGKGVKKLWKRCKNYCVQETIEDNELITRGLPTAIKRFRTFLH